MIRDAVFISVTIPRGRESSLGASGHFPPRGILPWVPAAISRHGEFFPGCQWPFPAAGNPSLGVSGHFPPRGILPWVPVAISRRGESFPGCQRPFPAAGNSSVSLGGGSEKERSTTGRPGGASREMGRVIAVYGWRVARGIWPFVWQNRCHALR